jgi:hypothetical protein
MAGTLLFDEKTRQSAALFWFGLRICWNSSSSKNIVDSPAFLEPVWKKCLWLVPLQLVCRRSRRLEGFLYEAAQNFEVFSNIEN